MAPKHGEYSSAAPAGTPVRWHFQNIFWPPDASPVVAGHRLAAVPFANSDRTEPLAVIYRKTRVLSPAMLQFVQCLKQSAEWTN